MILQEQEVMKLLTVLCLDYNKCSINSRKTTESCEVLKNVTAFFVYKAIQK
jgi:hypothetical protein